MRRQKSGPVDRDWKAAVGRLAIAAAIGVLAACGSSAISGPVDGVRPPGVDTSVPFPIDRGDDGGQTPGTYKGLWLRLVDNGVPDVSPVDGLIGLVCVGMSNARQECDAFIARVRDEWSAEISAAVRVVNCARGGHAIERWNDPAYDGALWDECVESLLPQAGLRADQVRVLYHKAANQFTVGPGGTPLPLYPGAGSDYEAFVANLSTFAERVKLKLPSVQAVYTSSRSYGGFANNPGRGEPLSYEEGQALNTWLRANRDVEGVWYGWGPYLWASDCATGESNGGGVCYVREDYVTDGVHPSETGVDKISRLLHERLLREAWYRR